MTNNKRTIKMVEIMTIKKALLPMRSNTPANHHTRLWHDKKYRNMNQNIAV